MQSRNLSVEELLGETVGLASRHGKYLIGMIAGMTALNQLANLLDKGVSATVAMLSASVAVQYFATSHLLEDTGITKGKFRFGTLLLAYFLTYIAVFIGLLALILPALLLMARWTLVAPLIVSGEMSAVQAMKTSWSETKGSQTALLVASVCYAAAYVGIVMLGLGLVKWTGASPETFFLTIPMGLLSNAVIVGGWLLNVAAFNMIVSGKGLRAVFS